MSLPRPTFPLSRDPEPILPLSTPEDYERSPSIPPSNQLGSSEKWLRSACQRSENERDTPLKMRGRGRTIGESPEAATVTIRRKKRSAETAGQIRCTDTDRLEVQSQWIAALAEAARTAIASGIEKAITAGIEAAVAKGIEKVSQSNFTNAAVAGNQGNPLRIANRASLSEDESRLSTRLDDAPRRGRDTIERSVNAQRKRSSDGVVVARTPDGRFAKKQHVAKQEDAQAMPRSPRMKDPVARSNRTKRAVSTPLVNDSNGRDRRADPEEQTNSSPSMTGGSAEHVDVVDASENRKRKRPNNTAKNAVADHTGSKDNSREEQHESHQVPSPLVKDPKGTSQGTKRKRETRSSLKLKLDHDSPDKGPPAGRNASPSVALPPLIAGDHSRLHRPATENNSKGKADSAVAAKKDKLRKGFRDECIAADGATGFEKVRIVERVEIPVQTIRTVEETNNQKPKEATRQKKKRKKTAVDGEQGESDILAEGEPSASRDHEGSWEGLDVVSTAVTKNAGSKEGAAVGEGVTVTKDTGIDIERKKRKAAERREKRKRRKAIREASVIGEQEPQKQGTLGEKRVDHKEIRPLKKTKKLVRNKEQSTGNRLGTDSQVTPESRDILVHATDDQDIAVSQQRRDAGKVTNKKVSVAETEMVVPDDSETTDDSDPECHRDLELPCGHKRRKNWNASLYHVDREGHRNRIGTWEELWRWTTRSKFSAQHPTVYKITPRSICPRCPGTSDRGRISGRHYFGDGYYWVVTYFQPPSGSRVASIINARNMKT